VNAECVDTKLSAKPQRQCDVMLLKCLPAVQIVAFDFLVIAILVVDLDTRLGF
jgi:hypothetical protein